MKKQGGIPEFNIALLGSKGVGKTSFIQRFLNNSFTPSYQPTTNVTQYTKVVDLKEDKGTEPKIVILHIFDMFPPNHALLVTDSRSLNKVQKKKAVLMKINYQRVVGNQARWEKNYLDEEMYDGFPIKNLKDTIHAYLFLFAVDDPISLTITQEEYMQVKAKERSHLRHAGEHPFKSKKLVVATKQDSRYIHFKVTKNFQHGSLQEKFIESLEKDEYFESSAMSNHNVEKVFKAAANKLIREKQNFVTYLERGGKKVKRKGKNKKDGSSSKGYWCCSGRSGPEAMTLKHLQEQEEEEELRSGSAESKSVSQNSDRISEKGTSKKPSKCNIF